MALEALPCLPLWGKEEGRALTGRLPPDMAAPGAGKADDGAISICMSLQHSLLEDLA